MSDQVNRQDENGIEDLRVGHETPGEFARLMDERAAKDGPAGVADELTIDDGAPPGEMAKQAAQVRAGVLKGEMGKERVPHERKVAEGPSRVRQKLTGVALQAGSIKEAQERLRECRIDIPFLSEARDKIEAAIAAIPFYRRGLVSVWTVIAVLAAVGLFDGAVSKSALDQTALDTPSIWLTAGGIAVIFAGINEAFGLLLAVIMRRAGRRRLWLVAGVLTLGAIGLFVSIGMLGWFRHEVAVSQNQSLSAIAAGRGGGFDFIIDPLFLAPLQGAGCIGAMAVVALHALSSDWRALNRRLQEATKEIARNEADILGIEREIAAAQAAGRLSYSQAFDAQADAEAAAAEVASSKEREEALVATEIAFGAEMDARYQGERNSQKQTYDNGKVRRAARPTEFGRRSSSRTPDAWDVEMEIDEPQKNGNGHKEDVDPEELFFDVRGF
ncbi:MAG TPA: hypothetical protein VF093_06665 [Solirubrobacterales bacterium]